MGPAMCSTAGMAFHTPSSSARMPAPAARGELFLMAWLIQRPAAPQAVGAVTWEAPRDALRGAEPHTNPDFAFPCTPVFIIGPPLPCLFFTSWGKQKSHHCLSWFLFCSSGNGDPA